VNELLQIEKIKQLKARYFRSLDTNDWASFADCLSADCTASYGDGKYSFSGSAEIVDFMSSNMSADTLLSMHNGHHAEISVAPDGATATGTWYLQDNVLDLANRVRLYGTGIYHDEYVNTGEGWKISHTGYSRIFECVEPLGEHHKVLRNMFATAGKE
jgi:hypothetical protein